MQISFSLDSLAISALLVTFVENLHFTNHYTKHFISIAVLKILNHSMRQIISYNTNFTYFLDEETEAQRGGITQIATQLVSGRARIRTQVSLAPSPYPRCLSVLSYRSLVEKRDK